jgi:CTP synthase (UTP-ammonia lyase)
MRAFPIINSDFNSGGIWCIVEQVVPHITDAIQDWIERVAVIPVDELSGSADVCVIELGGVVGIFLYYI